MKNASDYFSDSYAVATSKFIAACHSQGAVVEQWLHPLKGPENEELATYTAYVGRSDAPNVFMIVSGTHGLEGLAGSGCQISLLDRTLCSEAAFGYLFVHMLNPWGAAWGRRQNEDNIDLNRNFLSFGAGLLPANEDYDSLHDALMSSSRDHSEFACAQQAIAAFISGRGFNAYVAALFRGQYTQARGVNFGGLAPSWSNRTLRSILDRYVRHKRKALIVDLHTGLGPFGYGTVISTADAGSPELERLSRWFGSDFVSLSGSAHALPYQVVGDLCYGIRQALPDKELTGIALEFGTYEVEELVRLQIEDCLQLNHQAGTPEESRRLRERLTRFFLPQDPAWFEQVVARVEDVVSRMQRGFHA